MSNVKKSDGKYLWRALIALGFQPDVAASQGASKTSIKHVNLGPKMFDRPNKDAFSIVTCFLLEKLNSTRFRDEYRCCWPVVDHKADVEFRKVTTAWLREIMDGITINNTAPKVVPSLFVSPGGPKFISLMVHLANHVMLQEMKTFSTDDTWVPEAAGCPASAVDSRAAKRLELVEARFIRAAVAQDRALKEYQKRNEYQVKCYRQRRAEAAECDFPKENDADAEVDEAAYAQKIQKVRSLWATCGGLLATTEEQSRLDSVVRGDVDQYVLDGNNLNLKVPPALLQRIEKSHLQESIGSVYEAGQLNLLSLLEVLNQALGLLGEERSQHCPAVAAPLLDPQALLEKKLQVDAALENLRLIRRQISKEAIPEMKSRIRRLEEAWDAKWAETLKCRPLTSLFNDHDAPDFLSPMAPLTFEPASEACSKSSIFSQYPAKLLKLHDEPAESEPLDRFSEPPAAASELQDHFIEPPAAAYEPLDRFSEPPADTDMDRWTPVEERFKSPLSLSGLLLSPPTRPHHIFADSHQVLGLAEPHHVLPDPQAVPARAASPEPAPAPTEAVVSKRGLPRPKPLAGKNAAQILDWECNNLADQFSDAVTTSPPEGSVEAMDLGGLLSMLATDPFSTRKQLPRTPESLIRDVKNSWRKAMEEGEAQNASPFVVRLPCLSEESGSPTSSDVPPSPDVPPGPEAPSQEMSPAPPTAPTSPSPYGPPSYPPSEGQQRASLMSTLSWDSSNLDAFHSLSGDGSSGIVQFSIAQETLPELPCGDSMLSLDDGLSESFTPEKEEEELLLPHIPSLRAEPEPALLAARKRLNRIQQTSSESSYMDARRRTPEPPRPLHDRQASSTSDWLMASPEQTVATAETTDKVFSLDLIGLDSPLPPSKEYSLPTLVTFSP